MNAPPDADLDHATSYVVNKIISMAGDSMAHTLDKAHEESLLSTFDTRLQALAIARESLEKKLYRDIAVLAHRRNTLLPISRLPVEILAEAFHQSTRSSPTEMPHALQQILPLRLVSTHWKDVIDNTPHLWQTITSTAPPRIIELALRNAKSLLVDVAHCPSPFETTQARAGLEHLSSHMDRWGSASMYLMSRNEVEMLSRRSANSLESCTLCLSSQVRSVQPIDLLHGEANKLRAVQLRNLAIVWDTTAFSGLQSLVLDYSGPALTIPQLYTALERCQGLKELRLNLKNGSPSTSNSIGPQLTLSELATLNLNLPAVQANALLSVIAAPRCDNFSISLPGRVDEVALSPLLELLVPFFPLQSWDRTRVKLFVTISDSQFKYIIRHAISTKSLFKITAATHQLPAALAWLFDRTSAMPSVRYTSWVTITTEKNVLVQLQALKELRQVVWLDVGCGNLHLEAGVMAVVQYLSAPRRLASEKAIHWPFKYLRAFNVLNGPYDDGLLIAMFRNRYGLVNDSGHRGLPLPAPFTSVTFHEAGSIGTVVRDNIAEIVEGGFAGASIKWLE